MRLLLILIDYKPYFSGNSTQSAVSGREQIQSAYDDFPGELNYSLEVPTPCLIGVPLRKVKQNRWNISYGLIFDIFHDVEK